MINKCAKKKRQGLDPIYTHRIAARILADLTDKMLYSVQIRNPHSEILTKVHTQTRFILLQLDNKSAVRRQFQP